ncbi:uncharacterized protein LOC132752439, partial [Ruditapes philippinarum]|uniref:uncharacterized protein LOC132752439 n=1 Tax=Ruditapes philippinarum TaxID=129788 RepID=UPI00295BE5E3
LKKIDLKEEYPIAVYTLLVKKYLEIKVATLEKLIAKCEGSISDEVLTGTRQLLLQVEESITEDEPADLSELQEENNKLKERVKELENERDSLQSIVNQKEEENSWIKPLVDDHVDFKAIQFIATVAESRKEFFLLLESLPFAIKEKPEVVSQHQQEHIHEIPDPSLVTSNLQKLDSEKFWEWNCDTNPKHWRQWFGLKENFEDYCKHLVDCCQSIASLVNLIIPLFKGAFKQNKQETLELLNRHMVKEVGKFICETRNFYVFLDNLKSNFTGYQNCSYKSDFVRYESYLEKILPGFRKYPCFCI